jgi:hypothetical protein
LNPDYWYAYESAGASAFRLGYWAEAANDFAKAYVFSGNRYEYAIASAVALLKDGKYKAASVYAGGIAPVIDREKNGIYWSMLRLIQEQNDASAELELKIQAEKRLDIKAGMLFYLAEYWLARGKTELGAKYLTLSDEMNRKDSLEFRLLRAELKRLGIAFSINPQR